MVQPINNSLADIVIVIFIYIVVIIFVVVFIYDVVFLGHSRVFRGLPGIGSTVVDSLLKLVRCAAC